MPNRLFMLAVLELIAKRAILPQIGMQHTPGPIQRSISITKARRAQIAIPLTWRQQPAQNVMIAIIRAVVVNNHNNDLPKGKQKGHKRL
jgi:hypothetical protein